MESDPALTEVFRAVERRLRNVDVTAKPEHSFLPKDWEERTVPVSKEVVSLLRKHPRLPDCPLVFPSPNGKLNYRLHDISKAVAKRAELDPKGWHLHRYGI